jgi:glycerol kinase
MHRATPLQRLTITGGLAACDYLCEVLAEVTQMTVERPTLLEATSRGIAYLAAGQPPDWQPVPIEKSFAPTGKHAMLDRFDDWRTAMAVRTGAA